MILDHAWLPYYIKVKSLYLKKQHLDYDKKLIKELNKIYKFADIVPLFTTYKDLDEIKILISKL